jgi:3-oxoacyl-[acyl-carrier protein] reductase
MDREPGNKLKGKCAVVTGASKGIGAGIARAFAREGASVLINYNNSEKVALELTESLNDSIGSVVSFRADVSKDAERKALVSKALEEFGRIDVLVNNAGIIERNSFLETTESQFDRIIGVNLKSAYFLCHAVAPVMLKQEKGSIINISSISGLAQVSTLAHVDYVVSKAGLIGLTRSLAVALAPYVNVNAICPGTIETDMTASLSKETKEFSASESLLKRLGTPEDVAKAAVFLASGDSNFITGEIITVAGGRGMR